MVEKKYLCRRWQMSNTNKNKADRWCKIYKKVMCTPQCGFIAESDWCCCLMAVGINNLLAPWMQLLLKELLMPPQSHTGSGGGQVMQGEGGIVHDRCHPGQQSPLTHHLNGIQRAVQDRAGTSDQLVKSLPALLCATPAPADHCLQDTRSYSAITESSPPELPLFAGRWP